MSNDDLIARLRQMAAGLHDDMSTGAEAADALTAQANSLGFLRQISEQQAYEITQQAAEIEALRADAERYRWLRDTLHKAVGGGVEVNDARLVYEVPEPGESVRVYWYPDTPVGFYESEADTLDAAIDAALVGKAVTP